MKREYIWVLLLSLTLLIIGLVMLQYRWINPDEGAHISDARLLLEGKVPKVDFKARQPFYVFLLAVFLKIFGLGYFSCRLLPLLSSVGVSLLIYIIAKKLYQKESGLIAQLLYVFLPFTILYAPIVKMHNIVIFWGCLGILCYILFGEHNKLIYLLLSGLVLGLAFYVRESSLAWVAAVGITIILANGTHFFKSLKQLSVFLAGFFIIVILVLAIYLKYMSFSEFWNSPLNPFFQFLKGFSKIAMLFGFSLQTNAVEKIRLAGQDMSISVREVKQIFRMNLYLFLGFALFLFYWIKDLLNKRIKEYNNPVAFYFLPTWLMATVLVYGYYFFARGFFPAYATELYPPLIIGLSSVVVNQFSQNRKYLIKNMIILMAISYGVFALQKLINTIPDLSTYFVIPFILVFSYWLSKERIYRLYKTKFILALVVVLCLVLVSQSSLITTIISGKLITAFTLAALFLFLFLAIRSGWVKNEKIFVKYFATAMVIAAFISGFGESARYLSVSYDSVWSPETVAEVEHYLEANADSGETILSGAMIWAVNPRVRPYLDITHPTGFISEVEKPFVRRLKAELTANPPSWIVLDTFTKKCYHFIEQEFATLLETRYKKVKEVAGPRYVVSIYKLSS